MLPRGRGGNPGIACPGTRQLDECEGVGSERGLEVKSQREERQTRSLRVTSIEEERRCGCHTIDSPADSCNRALHSLPTRRAHSSGIAQPEEALKAQEIDADLILMAECADIQAEAVVRIGHLSGENSSPDGEFPGPGRSPSRASPHRERQVGRRPDRSGAVLPSQAGACEGFCDTCVLAKPGMGIPAS